MVHKKDWGPGYRFFKCDECHAEWKERSRDCTSQSSSICPGVSNSNYCDNYYGVSPYDNEPHYEWETDKSGNLVEE